MDEGYTINAVKAIQEKGSTILDSGLPYFCPMYCYPTALISNALGASPTSYRLLSVLTGLAFIVAMFFITRKLFNQNVAMLTSVALTFSYWQIAWSRQARWYTLFALFFWVALYFFHQSLYGEKNRAWHGIFAVVFTIFAIMTHGLGYLLPLIFIGWILIDRIFLGKKMNFGYLIKVISTIVVLATISLVFLSQKFGIHYELPYYVSFYIRAYWLFLIFLIIGFFAITHSMKREMYFLLFVLLSYLIPLSFLTNIVHYRYLFHVTPVFILLGTAGMLAINDNLKNNYTKSSFWIVLTILFFTIGGGVFIPRTEYFLESDNPETIGERPSYAYTPQPDWNAAYEFLEINREEGDIVISSQPQFTKIFLNDPGYWIKYDYLGFADQVKEPTGDTEYYVGAKVIDDLQELQVIASSAHGFVIFDHMSADGKIAENIISYIRDNFKLVFEKKTNPWSEVWIYKF
jgi:4-amino-4-deoxy-L-arabinose transferase-like glycosyltransferase